MHGTERVDHTVSRPRLARRSEGADPVNSNSQANAGRFDYNMYNLGLNFI